MPETTGPTWPEGGPRSEADFRRLAAEAPTHGDGFFLECAAAEIERLRSA